MCNVLKVVKELEMLLECVIESRARIFSEALSEPGSRRRECDGGNAKCQERRMDERESSGRDSRRATTGKGSKSLLSLNVELSSSQLLFCLPQDLYSTLTNRMGA